MKRHSKVHALFLSPSIHHLRHRKQSHVIKQKALNQNRFIPPVHRHRRLPIKSTYSSSSYTSLNSYLKEFHLSEKDFVELRQALNTLFHYLQPKSRSDRNPFLQQRLNSPYLHQEQSPLNSDDQSSVPLYIDEYLIRKGLLNHNDGPDIYDHHFQSINPLRSCLPSYYSSSTSSSPMNITLPLALLSNQKHLFTALTSNFVSEKSRQSPSTTKLTMGKYLGNEDDTQSIILRRNKVQTWQRDIVLQQNPSIVCSSLQEHEQFDASEHHRNSIVRTSSTIKDDKTLRNIEQFFGENGHSLRTCDKKEGNESLSEMMIAEEFFPMTKKLAPYIIIRDSSHLNADSTLPKNIDRQRNEYHVNHLTTQSEKRSFTDMFDPRSSTAKRQSFVLPSASITCGTQQTNQTDLVHQQKKNYLLAEFESVLTDISQK